MIYIFHISYKFIAFYFWQVRICFCFFIYDYILKQKHLFQIFYVIFFKHYSLINYVTASMWLNFIGIFQVKINSLLIFNNVFSSWIFFFSSLVHNIFLSFSEDYWSVEGIEISVPLDMSLVYMSYPHTYIRVFIFPNLFNLTK